MEAAMMTAITIWGALSVGVFLGIFLAAMFSAQERG